MVKVLYTPLIHRIVLGVLYTLFFSGLVLLSRGLTIAHWIDDNYGPGTMLFCVLGYAGTMFGLGWSINKISRSVPTFDPSPSFDWTRPVYEFEEMVRTGFKSETTKSAAISSDVADHKSATELKVTGKAQE